MTQRFILYGTYGCHLCDRARELVAQALPDPQAQLEEVDILDDPALEERYGIRIPVLRRSAGGSELNWPFDAASLQQFLQQ